MRKISYLLLLTTVVFSACKDRAYKKGDDGMEYKIIADGSGDKIKTGEYMQFEFVSLLSGTKDSVLNNTRETGAPQILLFDSVSVPPAYYKLFGQLRNGDSLSIRLMTDSIFKKNPTAMPPFMKKGEYVFTNFRVTAIYKTKDEADKATEANQKKQEVVMGMKNSELAKTDDKTLNEYFTKNNIKAIKTPKGAYIEVLQPATGAQLDTTVLAKVNYTGKTLAGIIFDSNTDPAKGHVEPLIVNLTNNPDLGTSVIPGFSDALLMMGKGEKANVYIPSGLGYGRAGAGGDIPANTNLIFNIEVTDIVTKDGAAAEKAAMAKKMQEAQKRYMDSMQKLQGANPAATPRP